MKFTIILIYVFIQSIVNNLENSLENIKKKHLKTKTNSLLNKADLNGVEDQLDATINPKVESEDLPDVPIYHRGWVKYFHYKDDKAINKPKSFFRNDAYFLQKKYISNDDVKKKDNVLLMLI